MPVATLGARLKEDTKANWLLPGAVILKKGEPGYESDTGRLKVGDGTKKWSELLYQFEFFPRREQSLTSPYPLVIADAGYVLEFTGKGKVKVPGNVFPENTIIGWCQVGTEAASITFEAGSGLANLRAPVSGAVTSRAQWTEGLIRYRTATEAIVSGDLT